MTPSIDTTSYPSLNYSARPPGVGPDMIVLHDGEGTKKSDLERLRNNQVPMKDRVSAHYYVDRQGHIYELIAPKYAAWHAGASFWEGRDSVAIRDHSIGIETEHKAGQDWPAVQREALRQLCLYLIGRYRIPQRLVTCHRWIAPGRKPDPTNWSNDDLTAWIAALYSPQSPSPTPPSSTPIDPLKARQIQGIDRTYFCGVGFYDYYQAYAGLRNLGYPLGDEAETIDTLGEHCTMMRFERGVLKYKASEKPWSIRPALLSELQRLGLV